MIGVGRGDGAHHRRGQGSAGGTVFGMSEHVAQNELPKLVRRLPDMRVTIDDHEMSSQPVIARQRDSRARRSPFLPNLHQSYNPELLAAPVGTTIVGKGSHGARSE